MTTKTPEATKWRFFDIGPITGNASIWRFIVGAIMTLNAFSEEYWSGATLYFGFALYFLAEAIYRWKGGSAWRIAAIIGAVLALVGIAWEGSASFMDGFMAGAHGAPSNR